MSLSKSALEFLISVMKSVRIEAFDENARDLGAKAQEVCDWLRSEWNKPEEPDKAE